jgi:DNA-binding HxlR family transcriptional regulator
MKKVMRPVRRPDDVDGANGKESYRSVSSRLRRNVEVMDTEEECPIIETIEAVVSEVRFLVVRHLFTGPKGFNELSRISGLNSKTLSIALKSLQDNSIVIRQVVSTKPFTVSYSLSKSGEDLKPIFKELGYWGKKWL